MQEMTISLKGLTCANCAGKIEHGVAALPQTQEVQINLLKQEMQLLLHDDANPKEVFSAVEKTVHRYESHVAVSLLEKGTTEAQHEQSCACDCCGTHTHHHAHSHTHSHTNINQIQFARFGIGLILFFIANIWSGTGSLICFLVSYLLFGYDVVLAALRNIAKGQVFDEQFLMSLSTIGAMCLGEMSEAVFVMLFYQVGEIFQEYALQRSRRSINALLQMRPDTAHIVTEDGIHTVAPQEVAVGDTIQVKAGERIPLDGIVSQGWAMLDTAALTGESLPRRVEVGNEVYSGCINTDGLLQIQVTKPFSASTVMKIMELVEHAAGNKSKTEKFITRFARIYTPLVVGLAVLLAVVPPLLGFGTWSMWIGRALIFLVVSCPCALVLSVPLTYFSGIGAASKNGILIKGGNDLDTLCHTNCMVFDKTGTLTKGKFSLTQILAQNTDLVLEYAAAAEHASTHPIAKAIFAAYGKEIDSSAITDYTEKGGYGITCRYQGHMLACGNARLLQEMEITFPHYTGNGSVVYLAVDGTYQGTLVIDDTLKENCADALAKLRKQGISKMVLLTGDRQETAGAVAAQFSLDAVHAQLLPWDKASKLEEILQENTTGKTAFVGDGINDAPVLAAADVGIAMGGIGADAAIEAADIVLMEDDLEKLSVALRIAKNTRKLVLQNIVFALGVKLAVLLLSAFGFASMWMAVFADVGVAVLAVCNAMRKK